MSEADKGPHELFKRADSPNWWMRFYIVGHGQKRIGLKTPDHELPIESIKIVHSRKG